MGLTKQQLEALNQSSFPNNNAGAITPDILRQYNAAAIGNTVNQDVYTADSASFSARIEAVTGSGGNVNTSSFATTGSNTFVGAQTITGSNGRLQYSGTNLSDTSLASIHANDSNPWLERFYNDSFSTSSAVMAYFAWDDGRFIFHNESTESIGIGVNGDYNNPELLVYEDKAVIKNDLFVSGNVYATNLTGSTIDTSSFATTGSNTFTGEQIISSSLIVTNTIKGTGSINLQPDVNDARFIEIYNTAATDTHITASGGNLFLGNDETFVLVTTYANQKEVTIRGDEGIHITGSITSSNDISTSANIYAANLTGSTINTGSFITTGSVGETQYIKGTLGVSNITTLSTGSTPSTANTGSGTTLYFLNSDINPNANPNIYQIQPGYVMSGDGITDGTVTNSYGDNNGYYVDITSGNVVSGSSYIGTGPYYPTLNITGSVYSNNGFKSPGGLTIANLDGTGTQYGNVGINASGVDPNNIFSGYIVDGGTPESKLQLALSSYNPMYSGQPVPTLYAGGYYDAGLGYGSSDTTITFFSSSINMWMPTNFKAPVQMTGSLSVSGSTNFRELTGSLASFSASVDTRILAAGGAPQVQEEGSILGNATSFNFIGSGVTATFSAGTASVTIPGGGGSIYTGSFAITGSNTFSGSQIINGNVNITGSLTASGIKYPTTDGTAGQFIITNGTGTLAFDDVHVLLEDVRYGENITLGDPLYVSGSNGNRPVVFKADASNSAKMPVIYVANSTAVANTNTTALTLGLITGVTTTGYAPGTTIYVAEGGGWSSSRPSGSASIVQSLGIVTKEGAGGSGRGLVLNPGPATLPNLQTGYAWVGNDTNQPTAIATASFATTASVNTLSASIYQTDATQSANITSVSSSVYTNTNSIIGLNAKTASYATTGSNSFVGNQIITGSLIISSSLNPDVQIVGSLTITGSVSTQPIAVTITSNTASIDFSRGSIYTLTLVSSSVATYVTASNLTPGQTANLVVTQASALSGSIVWASAFKFPTGTAYTGSKVINAVDLISFITVNNTTIYSVGAQNLV